MRKWADGTGMGDGYNNRRLPERIGHRPPAEAEKVYYASENRNNLAA